MIYGIDSAKKNVDTSAFSFQKQSRESNISKLYQNE